MNVVIGISALLALAGSVGPTSPNLARFGGCMLLVSLLLALIGLGERT
jgi:hypothetical protein